MLLFPNAGFPSPEEVEKQIAAQGQRRLTCQVPRLASTSLIWIETNQFTYQNWSLDMSVKFPVLLTITRVAWRNETRVIVALPQTYWHDIV